ncbi:MAG: hypothetical protein J0I41_19950 [Filimonas sp.]|nr:hypothetical protein [Filimonas sp.]
MKKNWLFATFALFLLNACKENKSGMVLSSMIIFDSTEKRFDTTSFISRNGRLASIIEKYQVIDSLTYDEKGRLTGYKWQEVLTNETISKCSIQYGNDVATKTDIPVGHFGDQTVTAYKLSKGLPVSKYLQHGVTRDTIIYTYDKEGDLIKMMETTYLNGQSFSQQRKMAYSSDCYQPFSTLGDQLFWELVYQNPGLGARKLQISNGVLSTTTVIEKQGKLPLKVTTMEMVDAQMPTPKNSSIQFVYTNQ